MILDDIPDNGRIYHIVSVGKNIAETDDALRTRDLGENIRILALKTIPGFTDDLKFSFHRGLDDPLGHKGGIVNPVYIGFNCLDRFPGYQEDVF